MLFYKRFTLFILFASFFNACSSDIDSIQKSDSKIIFYNSNHIIKEINLNENGQVIGINTYIDGYLDKIWLSDYNNLSDSLEYYGNGQIKTKGYLKNGKQHSLWEYFDRDGHLLIQRYFSYGKPSSIWIWYDHHNYGVIEKYELYNDIRDDGFLTRYYRSSNIKEQKQYSEKKLTGSYTLFYDDLNANGEQLIRLKGQYGMGHNLGLKVGDWQKFEKK